MKKDLKQRIDMAETMKHELLKHIFTQVKVITIYLGSYSSESKKPFGKKAYSSTK